jgi:hypothetical protein
MATPNKGEAQDRVIATIPRPRGEELRVMITNYKGKNFVAVRLWFADDDGEMRPSSKGVNLPIATAPALADGLAQAVKIARADGLLA